MGYTNSMPPQEQTPASLSPTPTPAPVVSAPQPLKSKLPWIIAGVILALVLAVGGYVLAQKSLLAPGIQVEESEAQNGNAESIQQTATTQGSVTSSCLGLSADLKFEAAKPLPAHPDAETLVVFYADYYNTDESVLRGQNSGDFMMALTQRVQKEYAVPQTGVVDAQTRAALEQACVSLHQKKRDDQRLVDLKSIRDAALAYANAYKTFPASLDAALSRTSSLGSSKSSSVDPLDGAPYIYLLTDNGRNLEVKVNLEQSEPMKGKETTFKQVFGPNAKLSTVNCNGVADGRYCYSFSYTIPSN